MFDDPLSSSQHPDLQDIDQAITRRLEAVLAAEQEAAAVLVRRETGLKGRLIEAEDRGSQAEVTTRRGLCTGVVTAVGKDHVELFENGARVLVPFARIISVRLT